MVRGIERYLGHRPLRIDPFFYRQRRTGRLGLTYQARVPRMRSGIERKPVERITATDECREFRFTEIGQQPACCRLSCCSTRILPFAAESAGDHLDCSVVELPQ